jgi:hypothetical protein
LGDNLEQVYRDTFLEFCSGGKCELATSTIASTINGKPGMLGCDLLEILYYSDVKNGYY